MRKKSFVITLCLLLIASPVKYISNYTVSAKTASATVPGIQPYSNKTKYIYKMENGKMWKRLWSYTYNRWEKPYWTLA